MMFRGYLNFLTITGAVFLFVILVLGAVSGDWAIIAVAVILGVVAFASLREAKRRARP